MIQLNEVQKERNFTTGCESNESDTYSGSRTPKNIECM